MCGSLWNTEAVLAKPHHTWLNHIPSQDVLLRLAIEIARQHHTHHAGLVWETRQAAGGIGSLSRLAAHG